MKSFEEYNINENNSNENLFSKWKMLNNMSVKEYKKFIGEESTITPHMDMCLSVISITASTFSKAEKLLTPEQWKFIKKQTALLARLKGMRKKITDNPFEKNGKKTKWLTSMMLNGYDPRKTK